MIVHSQSEADTVRIATDAAKNIQAHDIVLLHGTLGSGKTVFARALIRALTGNPGQEVPSPTFTLVQTYDSTAGPISHYDLYRLEDPEEIFELAWEEALAEGIAIIEWPERLGPYLPQKRLDIRLSSINNNPDARQIHIERKE